MKKTMAECKSCIHGNVCLHKSNIETDTYAYMGVKFDTEKCKHFMSADVVEVGHGSWIFEHDPIKDPKKYFIRIVCSCCGLKTSEVSNFCPMCGAKMDGERKENP